MEQNPLFRKVPGNVPIGGCGLGVHLKHQPDICRFVWIYHQLFCVDTVHLNRLCMKAVRGFPTHLEASLAAGIVSVRYPLLYRFPFKLGEHDTDIQHRPPHRRGGVKLLRRGHKLHIVLLEQLHHIGKVQNGTADTVELVNHDFCNQAPLDVPHQFLKLRTVCVLAAVPLVCVFLAATAFQLVFAKFNLAFNGNAVLFVHRLSCIDRVYPVVHIVAPFLKKETELLTALLYRQQLRKSTMALENLMPRLPHSAVCRHTCGTPHKAAVPAPGVLLLPAPA